MTSACLSGLPLFVLQPRKSMQVSLNYTGMEKCTSKTDSGRQQLFIIAKDCEFQYCFFRVSKPENSDDESIISELGEPVLKLNLTYPLGMQFVAIGPKIFMVGGSYPHSETEPLRASDNTYIYDTSSGSLDSGPKLNSGKSNLYLFTIGSKIFALSEFIYCAGPDESFMDCEPLFEVLDTEDLKRGWSPLPLPELRFSSLEYLYRVDACAASYVGDGNSSAIFISVKCAGTYAFDLDKIMWNYVSDAALPFEDLAVPMPRPKNIPGAPSLCCALSSKSLRFSAFRFHYHHSEGDENSCAFKVEKIKIDDSLIRYQPLGPETCYERRLTVFDSIGRAYIVKGGVDNMWAVDTNEGNYYVNVEVCEVKCSVGQKVLRSCKTKKKKKKRRKMEDDENRDNIVELDSNKGQVLKKCTKKKRSREAAVEEKFMMSRLWRRCYFGGAMGGDLMNPITAAFAI